MEEIKRSGLAKSIGVSNFNSQQLTKLLETAETIPSMNQVESHPFLIQNPLIEFCHKNTIQVTAYSPLGGSPIDSYNKFNAGQLEPEVRKELFGDAVINHLAIKYRKSVAQILLKFHVQRNLAVVPKSVTKLRILENINIFEFELEPFEVKNLESLDKNFRYMILEKFKDSANYPFLVEF